MMKLIAAHCGQNLFEIAFDFFLAAHVCTTKEKYFKNGRRIKISLNCRKGEK